MNTVSGKEKVYLSGGNGSSVNWWKYALPFFNKFDPVPLNLPGHDNQKALPGSIDELASEIIRQTEESSFIISCGINALPVLRAQVNKPGHFKKIILVSPVGACLWERKLTKYFKSKTVAGLARYFISRSDYIKRFLAGPVPPDENIELLKDGYKKCNAFQNYFKIINPYDAFDLAEWIRIPIHIMWGKKDKIVDFKEVSSWEAILARAYLTFKIHDEWGHYPYVEDPKRFAEESEKYFASPDSINKAHTKSSRIKLAEISEINIPASIVIRGNDYDKLKTWLSKFTGKKLFAVRSSDYTEDSFEESKAGMLKSFIRVGKAEVIDKAEQLINEGYDEALIQEFIEPEVSGAAFVRNISCEIEWVHGHLSELLQGRAKPFRAVISKMKGEWDKGWNKSMEEAPFTVMLDELAKFLKECISKFHYRHSDIEWAWDGDRFYLLQIRPVTVYNWHRFVTSANLDEILPKRVSRLMDHAQRRAAESISRIYALWDQRVLEDNEPFTSVYDNASYINCDLFLSRFRDWGLPSKLFNSEIGSATPKIKFSLLRFMRNLPRFIKMLIRGRKYLLNIESSLLKFENEFEMIKTVKDKDRKENELVTWFVIYYLFIVRTNIILKACLSSAGGDFIGKPKTVYAEINDLDFPHRLRFESDPAIERSIKDFKPLIPFPGFSDFILFWHKAGLPGMRGKYIEIREWFRDNNMRLFQRLHKELKGSEWIELSDGIRYKTGSFWQDENGIIEQDHVFVIYQGKAEGIAGKDIMIVETLEAGLYKEYKKAKAVIAKTGGKLSHGAILLRELKIPSAVIGNLDIKNLYGKKIIFNNGKINFN